MTILKLAISIKSEEQDIVVGKAQCEKYGRSLLLLNAYPTKANYINKKAKSRLQAVQGSTIY